MTPAERRALQRRLDRWELDHLRSHSAALAERVQALEAEAAHLRRARDDAEDRAGFWHDQTIGYYQDEQERGAVVGLAIDGSLSIVQPAPPTESTPPVPHGWTAEEDAAFRAKSAAIYVREQAAKAGTPHQ